MIGAGPVGLFQVFQLGLLEIACHVVDSLSAPGGQCMALYPDKPIYDIPALPRCTGRELVERLLTQIEPMAPTFHLSQQVTTVAARADGRYDIGTSTGNRFTARTVFIAGGVGAFSPRQLKLDGISQFAGRQLFYSGDEPPSAAGCHVIVLGDDDDALDTALALSVAPSAPPASVTLMHRRDAFKATPERVERMRAACAAGRMRFVAAQAIGFDAVGDTLTHLHVVGADASTSSWPCDMLLVRWGLSPKLGPIADWGVPLARKQVVVNTETFETALSGVFAVGDVITYPAKKKLILCGFHEATLAAYGAAARLRPDRATVLEYTTTSTRLHRVLGVTPPP